MRLFGDNPALIVFAGPGYGFDDPNIGVILVNETQLWGMVIVALMSIFMVNRHTRAEEESERLDLVRANVVGRHAPTAASTIVIAGSEPGDRRGCAPSASSSRATPSPDRSRWPRRSSPSASCSPGSRRSPRSSPRAAGPRWASLGGAGRRVRARGDRRHRRQRPDVALADRLGPGRTRLRRRTVVDDRPLRRRCRRAGRNVVLAVVTPGHRFRPHRRVGPGRPRPSRGSPTPSDSRIGSIAVR